MQVFSVLRLLSEIKGGDDLTLSNAHRKGKKSRDGHAVVCPVIVGNPSITITMLLPPRNLSQQ